MAATLLMRACKRGHIVAATLLMRACKRGHIVVATLLMRACKRGHIVAATLLMRACKRGHIVVATLLMRACKRGHIVAATLLMRACLSNVLPSEQHLWWTQILCHGCKKKCLKNVKNSFCVCVCIAMLPCFVTVRQHGATQRCPSMRARFAWAQGVVNKELI